MKRTQNIYILLIVIVCISCGSNYRLGPTDLNYIPYEGKEILIFKSDLGRMDTIFIKKLERFNGCYDPLLIISDNCQGYRVITRATDPNNDRYIEGKGIVSIEQTKSGETLLYFGVNMKGSKFYEAELSPMSLSQFDSIPLSSMKIGNKKYTDVKVLQSDGYFRERDNFAERLYWSVSQGFLGLDRKNEQWRLIKKYLP